VTDEQPSRNGRLILAAIVALIAFALDLWTKQWAWDHVRPPDGQTVPVIDRVFYLRYGFNTGSAFSFLRDASWARTFFISVTLFALGYMGWMVATMPTKRRYGFVAVALIAGGAAGNLYDRITRIDTVRIDGELVERHGVVDFLQVYLNYDTGYYWPIFNVADMALCVGVGLLLIFMYQQGKDDMAAEAAAEAAAAQAA
jgi:signal peptidase II